MSSYDTNRFSDLVDRLKAQYEREAAEYGEDRKAKAAAAARAAKHKADKKAIRALEATVIPLLEAAKAGIEASGLDVIISKNWNYEGATLSTPTVRFQCASRVVPSGTGYPTLESKVAVFCIDGSTVEQSFEGPEALPFLTARPGEFDSDDELIAWAVEEVVASYYRELAKLTYLKA
ncbi:MAG TPA: hypothetical protein VIQ29_18850 [Ancylobacter sp.]